MSDTIYGKCPKCHRFTWCGEEKNARGNRMLRFYACFMCGYHDDGIYEWHMPSPNDPSEYTYKAVTTPA